MIGLRRIRPTGDAFADLAQTGDKLRDVEVLWVVRDTPQVPDDAVWVPGFRAGAAKTRSDLIRFPAYKPRHEGSMRIELRSPDAACNPYLVFSVLLAAGLEGLRKKLEPPEPVQENVFAMTDEERRRRGITQLPSDLHEAIQLAQGSALARQALGSHVFDSFLANKRLEWERYRAAVTDFDLKTYLPIL